MFLDLLTASMQDDSEAPSRKLPSCGDIDTGGKQRSNEDKDEVARMGWFDNIVLIKLFKCYENICENMCCVV